MTTEPTGTGDPDGNIELSLTDARSRLPKLTETTIRDGGIVYLTRYGRRATAIVPADVAENYERMENAYLSALADEAKADTEAPLSTAELVKACCQRSSATRSSASSCSRTAGSAIP